MSQDLSDLRLRLSDAVRSMILLSVEVDDRLPLSRPRLLRWIRKQIGAVGTGDLSWSEHIAALDVLRRNSVAAILDSIYEEEEGSKAPVSQA